jgi:hypothetical protein
VGERQVEREINGFVSSNVTEGDKNENDSNGYNLTVEWIKGCWIRRDKPGKTFRSKRQMRRKKNWLRKRKPSRR